MYQIFFDKQIGKRSNIKNLPVLHEPMVHGTAHNVWTGKHPRDNRCAIIKARFLTRSYMLQTTKALFGDKEVLCPLWKSAAEARVHFIAERYVLEDIRQAFSTPVLQTNIPKSRITDTTTFRSHTQPIERTYNLQEICAV